MMTSTSVTPQQQTDGRTVREVVEFNQELVHEVWCRRIFRQILQSLELQYAMQMPHRPISPDTLLVLDSGDPMLLPSPDVGAGWSEAGDLHDLAAVVHYAITREYPPAAPLAGRVSSEYSDTFVTAVDRCLSPDPQARPRTIEELRNLLGIVPLGPALPNAASQPAQASRPVKVASVEPEPSFLGDSAPAMDKRRLQRWLLLVAAATVLLAALGALFALLHQADSRDTVTLALPGDAAAQADARDDPPGPPPVPDNAPDRDTTAVLLPDAAAPTETHPPAQPQAPAALPPTGVATAPAASGPTAVVRPLSAAIGATYKLLIKPWGMIQVDGVDRGASPPLKRLTLPPGEHTIRITNPNYAEHTVVVNSVKGDASVIELDFSEEGPQ